MQGDITALGEDREQGRDSISKERCGDALLHQFCDKEDREPEKGN
jgi:hypothetical protein